MEERSDIPLDPAKDIRGGRQRENLSGHALVERDVLPGKPQADIISDSGLWTARRVALVFQP